MTNQIENTQPALNKSERLYALDALRGIMMLLGILLHTMCTYCIADLKDAWLLKDPNNTNFIFDILIAYIHSFRMPVFFITSGFFVALLTHKKGISGMMNNRVKRILLPFLAGVILICPLISVALAYSQLAFKGDSGASSKAFGVLSDAFPPSSTEHLWFLYFLIIYVFAIWLLSVLFQKSTPFTKQCTLVFKRTMQNFWLRFLFVSVAFFLFLFWMQDPFIVTSETWVIYFPSLLMYFFFFLLGWGIFRTDCLSKLMQLPLLQIGMGSLLVLVYAFTPWPAGATWVLPVQQGLSAVFSTLLIFGFIALFLTYFNRFSPTLSYLMDAAYWVYIIHLPIVVFLPGLLAGSGFPLIAKFLIVLLSTAIICFGSYRLFVRNSFIGMFLNGKVHKKKKAPNNFLFEEPQLVK